MQTTPYTTLFLDVGGVFLTNGWDRHMREKAAQKFSFDLIEFDKRHALTFDTYEIGHITLDVYLDRVIFYTPRAFSREEFKAFMFAQSEAYENMIQFIRDLKNRYSLCTVAVSNEGRELMEYRIHHFKMKEFIDFFVCSCFIGYKKPDIEMYRLALDIAQVKPQDVIYLDDRQLLSEVGGQLGMKAIQHKTYEQTQVLLNELLEG